MRRSGRTTRIIDELVQDYFEHGAFVARDHYYEGIWSVERSSEILKMVARRLSIEHNINIKLSHAKLMKDKGTYMYMRTDNFWEPK